MDENQNQPNQEPGRPSGDFPNDFSGGNDQPATPSPDQPISPPPAPAAGEHVDSTFENDSGATFGQDPAADAPAPEPAAAPAAAAPRRRLPFGRLLLIPLVLLILAGAAFAATRLLEPSPEKVLGTMIERFPELRSAEFSSEVKVRTSTATLDLDELGAGPSPAPAGRPASPSPAPSAESGSPEMIDFVLSINGIVDNADSSNLKSSLNLAGSVEQPGQKISVGAELKTLGKDAYARLTQFPTFGTFDLSSVMNQWIKLDSRPESGEAFPPEKVAQIKQAMKEAKALRVVEKRPSEKIDGQDMHVYTYELDPEATKKLLLRIQEITTGKAPSEEDIRDLDESFSQVRFQPGEIAIGKKDYLPHKVVLPVVYEAEGDKIEVTLTFNLKNVNQPAVIEAPTDARPADEVLGRLGLGAEGADKDQDKLSDLEEAVHGTDAAKPDTDGDGFKDGDEVNRGYNPKGPGKLPAGSPGS